MISQVAWKAIFELVNSFHTQFCKKQMCIVYNQKNPIFPVMWFENYDILFLVSNRGCGVQHAFRVKDLKVIKVETDALFYFRDINKQIYL